MESPHSELRPRTVLDLLDATVRLYRRHFAPLLGISAVLLVPFGVAHTIGQFYLSLGLQPLMTAQPPFDFRIDVQPAIIGAVATGVAFLIVSVLGPLSQGALALAISEQYLGRTVSIVGAYRRVLKYWWSLFLVGIVFGLLVSVGLLVGGLLGAAIGIPVGIYVAPEAGALTAGLGAMFGMIAGVPVFLLFYTWFVFYEQAMVLEDMPGLDSLQRSRELVRGRGWHVFATIFLTIVGISIATAILAAPISVLTFFVIRSAPDLLPYLNLLSQCMQHVINVLVGPVYMIVQTLLYYDLRIRKEGFDLQMMAAALGPSPDEGPPDEAPGESDAESAPASPDVPSPDQP